jgi:hypothetical protein
VTYDDNKPYDEFLRSRPFPSLRTRRENAGTTTALQEKRAAAERAEKAERELQAANALLTKLEWDRYGICQICLWPKSLGEHDADCELAAHLRGETPTDTTTADQPVTAGELADALDRLFDSTKGEEE